MLFQGGDVVVVSGDNFGPFDSAGVLVQYGSEGRVFTAANCSTVRPAASDAAPATQAVHCVAVAGVGKDLLWTVSVRQQTSVPFGLPGAAAGAASASLYVKPSVELVAPSVPFLSTRGRQTVVVRGANFGPLAASGVATGLLVTYGPVAEEGRRYIARSCVVTVADVEITCATASGVGANHVWRVTVGSQESNMSVNMTSYAGPTLTAVTGQGTFQAKTDGGQLVTLTGTEFGSAVDTVNRIVVLYGPPHGNPANVSRFNATNCAVDVDHSSISCLTAPGTGKGHSWLVLIDGVASPLYAANTSYGAPVVALYNGMGTVGGLVDCSYGDGCGSTRGSQYVNISGQNFGSAELNNTILVRYGVNGTELTAEGCVIAEPHVLIVCNTVPAAGTRLKWTVIIGTFAGRGCSRVCKCGGGGVGVGVVVCCRVERGGGWGLGVGVGGGTAAVYLFPPV
jgi:hypothetical protein